MLPLDFYQSMLENLICCIVVEFGSKVFETQKWVSILLLPNLIAPWLRKVFPYQSGIIVGRDHH